VLVVDDEPDVCRLLCELYERWGYEVEEVADGRSALRSLYADPPDMVVLDLMMPELDGWKTLERIRDVSDVPVLMLTARDNQMDRVRGLREGADDYLTKPFDPPELLARTEALLRRAGAGRGVRDVYADPFLTVDFASRTVTVAEQEIPLTPREFKLLAVFVKHPNQVLSANQLLELVWSDPNGLMRGNVKLYVGYLRKKLGTLADGTSPIETVRGFGYRYRRLDAAA
jgi:DNA-binding response OmpR family regulator